MKRRTPLRSSVEKARAWERRSRRALPVRRKGVDPVMTDRALHRDGGCLLRDTTLTDQACWGRLDPHHVQPRGRGGPDELWNLITLCRAHHDWVHAHPELSRAVGLLR